jgi:hypothetical protein
MGSASQAGLDTCEKPRPQSASNPKTDLPIASRYILQHYPDSRKLPKILKTTDKFTVIKIYIYVCVCVVASKCSRNRFVPEIHKKIQYFKTYFIQNIPLAKINTSAGEYNDVGNIPGSHFQNAYSVSKNRSWKRGLNVVLLFLNLSNGAFLSNATLFTKYRLFPAASQTRFFCASGKNVRIQ